jgi:hypothetical protein
MQTLILRLNFSNLLIILKSNISNSLIEFLGYSDTRVFLSNTPFNFGSIMNNTAVKVGEIPSHAPEVIRDVDGEWYITRSGWGQGI